MPRSTTTEPVLTVRDLRIDFETAGGVLTAVDGISLELFPGEILGIVGESGSGKSVTVTSILGLVPTPPGRVVSGEALFHGRDLLQLPSQELNKIRGNEISMIFQDPMTSFNPVIRIGHQIREVLLVHRPEMSKAEARARVVELLSLVGVPDADQRYEQYPHEFSGGMRQRAMIAMAIANEPRVLIADEPTTALDVTVQAQVLDVLRTAQRETDAAIILITHDLGLIAEIADRVIVMYGGRIMEVAPIQALFEQPRHPYTIGLMSSLPRLDTDMEVLHSIPGQPPSHLKPPPWCVFKPRCLIGRDRNECGSVIPPLEFVGSDQQAACLFVDEVDRLVTEIEDEIGIRPNGDGA